MLCTFAPYILCSFTPCMLCSFTQCMLAWSSYYMYDFFCYVPTCLPSPSFSISTGPASSRWASPYVPRFCLRFLPDKHRVLFLPVTIVLALQGSRGGGGVWEGGVVC